ncbi:MAG: cysteine desulfurase [Ruminococcaceae bacterium]|nr:cysteine desulfurase [Oscillospiraceae bacterium]
MIYLDNAATTRVCKAALDAMLPFLTESFGNPSSSHSAGAAARGAVLEARESMARLLSCEPREIYFTSGGTESDNLALFTAAKLGAKAAKRHIISADFEHPAVLKTLVHLSKNGYEITLLPTPKDGIIKTSDIKNAMRGDTALVSLMTVNNEIGTVQSVREIGALCRECGVLFHTDAVQAAGHITLNFNEINADFLTLSAHKFGGAKGAGAVIIRKGIEPSPMLFGGGQERGARAGTENVAGIVGMAAALENACCFMKQNTKIIAALKNRLCERLNRIDGAHQTCESGTGIISFCFESIESEALLLLLDKAGVCASAGSACSAGALEPSHVLRSMNIPNELLRGALRLSLSAENTADEIEKAANIIEKSVEKLRSFNI